MFKMKKIAAVVAATVMALSAMAVSASAYSTSYTNTYYFDQFSKIQPDTKTNSSLSVYYMYEASKEFMSDMTADYCYNDLVGYKYATISYGGYSKGGKDSDGVTNVKVKATTFMHMIDASNVSSSVTYGGYCKTEKNSTKHLYELTYALTLTQ